MKNLHHLVNIIPVIAKADTLTPTELRKLKLQIMQEIRDNGIQIYTGEIDEEDDSKEIRELRDAMPFAVVSSTTLLEVNGKRVRGRLYPWGVVEVENKSHCDFVMLRNMLIRTHMQDLKDYTQDVHYENFRKQKILQEGSPARRVSEYTDNVVPDERLKAKDRELEEMRRQIEALQRMMQKQGHSDAV